ncbi:MAG: hypothetical protein LBT64_00115 [Puniceicoccales bacterium]|jgi:hypothetical protein|nr:hypothetical protein [Puniceicoccales bacterium]
MTESTLSNAAIGTHDCNITKRAEEAIPTKYLLGKFGTLPSDVGICGALDIPIGVITDEAAAPSAQSEKAIVNVALLGSPTTLRVVAGAPVEAGDVLVVAGAGKVKPLPDAQTDSQTYGMVGIAMTGAVADGLVEFMSCVPQRYTVEGTGE